MDVLFRLDCDLRHLFVSTSVRDLSDRAPASFLGRSVRELGFPEDASALFETAARRVLATGDAQDVDYPVRGAILRSRLIPELDERGQVRSIVGITEDVTSRRRAERDAEFVSRLGQTLSVISDPDRIVRTVTRALGAHLGCDRCYFGEIDAAAGTVVVHPDWARDGAPSVAGRYRLADFGPPELWSAVQAGRIAIDDVAAHPLTRDVAVKYRAMGVGALANAGFATEGRWVVHLAVNQAEARHWRDDELALLETIAARVWPLVLRARSEQALRESEARWRFALEAGRMVAWDCDPRTGRTILSGNAAEVLGLRGEPVVADLDSGFLRIHPDDRERHRATVREALGRGDGYTSQIRVIRPDDGRVVWVEDRGKVHLDENGRPTRVTGVIMDVTDKVTAEQQARRLASILEATPDFVAISRSDGELLYLNRAGRRMVGLPETPDAALPHADALLPAWALQRTRHEWLPIALRDGVVSDEGALRDAGGREIPVSFVLLVHRDEAGELGFLSTVARDITERKQVEEALREADRRKDEFLAMLAHELRNPLAPIRNAVEILKLRLGDDPKLEWPRDIIDRQVQHLTRLVDDLLDVSRITRGRIELKKEVVDVVTVVGRAVEASRPLVDARKQRLEVSLPAETLRLEGDATRLSQVLSNLLHNAVKYSEEGGRIVLHAEREGDDVALRVRDDGIGIAPEMLPYVFELFTQAERTLDRAQGGLGIGLTVVKRLVEMHGGSVGVHSEGTGRGSEFVVRLPLVHEPAGDRRASPSAAAAADAGPASHGRRILVVDDNLDAAESMAMLLRLDGHDVTTAHDGPSALEAARPLAPDVVLLDIGLPGMNGYEVARALRADPRARGAVLIALTGYGTAEDRERALGAGFDHHLTKPVEHDVLSAVLTTLTSR